MALDKFSTVFFFFCHIFLTYKIRVEVAFAHLTVSPVPEHVGVINQVKEKLVNTCELL